MAMVAISYQRLVDECDLTQEALGERVGMKRSTVTNYLRLLKLPPQVQKAIVDRIISMGHARAIINMDSEKDQIGLFKEIIKESLSVRATEAATRKSRKAAAGRVRSELPIELERIRDRIGEQLSTKVNIRSNAKGKGNISIDFHNEADLKRVLSLLDLWP